MRLEKLCLIQSIQVLNSIPRALESMGRLQNTAHQNLMFWTGSLSGVEKKIQRSQMSQKGLSVESAGASPRNKRPRL